MYVLELGGEDDAFAAYEAESAASAVERIAAGLATARGITDRVRGLAFTHRASELVGRGEAAVDDAVAIVQAAAIEREGTVAVRARDVRGSADVDTQAAESRIGQILVDRGFTVDLDDPDHELRALFAEDSCAIGWLAAESVRDFGDRQPTERPFFQPGSMDPLLARALANVAGARAGATILDPMCGTGGILLEAAVVGARTIGLDAQRKMVEGSRENLQATVGDAVGKTGAWEVFQGDARSVPLEDDAADAVVFDAPYGRQSKITGELGALVEGALREGSRIAPRCVVVGDRPWARVANDTGWTTEAAFQRRVHQSLTRHIVVLRTG